MFNFYEREEYLPVEKKYSVNEKDVIIMDYSPEFGDQYVEFANETFGKNYISKDELLTHVNRENEICTIAVEEKTNKLVGFCIFYEETPEETMKNFQLSQDEFDKLCEKGKNICHVKSISIKEDHKKTGLSFELFERNVAKAKKLGFSVALVGAWKRGDYVPAKKLLVNHGFLKLKTVPYLWYDDKNYNCVDCNGPCKCDGVVYYKNL